MFLFALCLFIFVLNSGHGGAYGQSHGTTTFMPMDLNDDFSNRNLKIKPNENIIFSFQQIRKDQPPQIEQRNENIGRYMNKKPKITTAMPKLPSLDNFPEIEYLPHVPTPIVPIDTYNHQWTNHVSAFPPTIPPPPSTPKWADLSDILNKQAFPHYNTPTQTTSSFNPQQQHYPLVHPGYYQPYVPAPSPELPVHTVPSLNQDIHRRVSHMPSKPVQEQRIYPDPPKLSTNRGRNKFNWNDVKTTTTTYAPPSTVSNENRGPPRSFPTLSPWADGFGK